MAFPKKPQSPEPTKLNLDEAFAVDETGNGSARFAEKIPTGFSEEEDAARLLAIHFNALFCRNCETYHEQAVSVCCPRCYRVLSPVGTPPLTTKRKHL